MIHVILGTKAQMVKMAPLMRLLESERGGYNFIFTGQHKDTIDDIRNNFSIKAPDYYLYEGREVVSVFGSVYWLFSVLFNAIFHSRKVFKGDKNGVVLVHGDTISTAIGAIIGKLLGHRVGHIESGLRSFNVFHPFPEELTRLLVFNLSDYYFCPGEWAVNNVASYRGCKIDTKFNTQMDAVKDCWNRNEHLNEAYGLSRYCVVSTHRFENWSSKRNANNIFNLIELIASEVPVIFVMHPFTMKKLNKYGLLDQLRQNANIIIRKRSDFYSFINLVSQSEFVVTDGGSNQEECAYLGKPCLLLRKASERREGINENVVLSGFDEFVVRDFLSNYDKYAREPLIDSVSPSQLILEFLRSQGALK